MSWVYILVGLCAAGAGLWGAISLGRARALSAPRVWSFAGQRVHAQVVAGGWRYSVGVPRLGFTLVSVSPGGEATLQSPLAIRDPLFDRRFVVEGPAGARVLLYDRRLRSGLIGLADMGAVVLTDGELVVVSREVSSVLAQIIAETALLLRTDGLLPRLREAATTDPLPEVREGALRALDGAGAGDGHWSVALSDPSPEIRLKAATRLATPGEPTLWKLAEDPSVDRNIRRRAAEVLVGPGGSSAYTARGLAVVLPHPALAAMVARRLPQARLPASVIALLSRALSSPDEGERASAVMLLARHGTAEVEPLILPLLHDPVNSVRGAAIGALGSVGGPAAVRAMNRLAVDPSLDPGLQVELARSIARCDPRGVVRG